MLSGGKINVLSIHHIDSHYFIVTINMMNQNIIATIYKKIKIVFEALCVQYVC